MSGKAIMIIPGPIVINENGAFESMIGTTIIGGLTSGNVRSMNEGFAALHQEFAAKSELTTDDDSADDLPPAPVGEKPAQRRGRD